tara:strand:- start:24 stop:134 length:111 start_codon:yes stop_codon:yes gene_type:complete
MKKEPQREETQEEFPFYFLDMALGYKFYGLRIFAKS